MYMITCILGQQDMTDCKCDPSAPHYLLWMRDVCVCVCVCVRLTFWVALHAGLSEAPMDLIPGGLGGDHGCLQQTGDDVDRIAL